MFLYRFDLERNASSERRTRFVNPFVGTGAVDGGSLAGNTFPGATVPFGMVQLSPDVEDFSVTHEGYEYGRDRIFGFSHTHQSGVGAADLQDILLMPTGRPLEGMLESPTRVPPSPTRTRRPLRATTASGWTTTVSARN